MSQVYIYNYRQFLEQVLEETSLPHIDFIWEEPKAPRAGQEDGGTKRTRDCMNVYVAKISNRPGLWISRDQSGRFRLNIESADRMFNWRSSDAYNSVEKREESVRSGAYTKIIREELRARRRLLQALGSEGTISNKGKLTGPMLKKKRSIVCMDKSGQLRCKLCGSAMPEWLSNRPWDSPYFIEHLSSDMTKIKWEIEELERQSRLERNLLIIRDAMSSNLRKYLAFYRLHMYEGMECESIADLFGLPVQKVEGIIGETYRGLCLADDRCIFKDYFKASSHALSGDLKFMKRRAYTCTLDTSTGPMNCIYWPPTAKCLKAEFGRQCSCLRWRMIEDTLTPAR